jgi:hypothetical protein
LRVTVGLEQVIDCGDDFWCGLAQQANGQITGDTNRAGL